MPYHLTRKLGFSGQSPVAEAVAALCAGRACEQQVPTRTDIYVEGDRVECARLIVEGWACQYKQLEDGRRQITEFLLPGDLFDRDVFLLPHADHSVAALSPLRCVKVSRDMLDEMLQSRELTDALRRDALISASIQRQWLMNLGQLHARERIAHLLCELFVRASRVGLVENSAFDFPVTQRDLSDATGLSVVHVNRVIKEMRGLDLVTWRHREMRILDFEALASIAGFNSLYLQLDQSHAPRADKASGNERWQGWARLLPFLVAAESIIFSDTLNVILPHTPFR